MLQTHNVSFSNLLKKECVSYVPSHRLRKDGCFLNLRNVTFLRISILSCLLLPSFAFTAGMPSSSSANQSHVMINYRKSTLALLSGTLQTYQKASCDQDWVNLKCPLGTTISIQFSQYGRTAATPALCGDDVDLHMPPHLYKNFTCYSQTVYQTISNRCQKKQECKFQVTPRNLGGDPCPHTKKFVEVAYKCRPSQFKGVIGCEHDIVKLSCSPNSRLAIYSANFGRTEYESIQCPQPTFVEEETCLASHTTEKVMNMCHGKRECSIPSEAYLFGRPCRPQSKNYLKVIHTCVPRKVLQKRFRGELEADEIEDDDSDETIEQSSVPSQTRNHPFLPQERERDERREEEVGLGVGKDGSATFEVDRDSQISQNQNPGHDHEADTDTFAQSSVLKPTDTYDHNIQVQNQNQSEGGEDVRFINLISQSINAYAFIERNSHTFWLLVAISMLSVFLILLFLLLLRLLYVRHKGKKKAETEERMKSSSIRRASGLSDIDELSLVLDPNDYMHLSTIQRRSNPSSSTFTNTNPAKSRVVRYSNSRNSGLGLGRQESDTSPRSFHQDHESDIHFFFG